MTPTLSEADWIALGNSHLPETTMSTNDTRQKLIAMSHDLPLLLADVASITENTLLSWQETLSQAVKDSEMLDWLEGQRCVTFSYILAGGDGLAMDVGLLSRKKRFVGATKREAITAAMQKEEEGGSEGLRPPTF